MSPVFTWTTEADHSRRHGKRYVMRSPAFPKHHFSPLCADDRLAVCAWDGLAACGKLRWRASFFVEYESIGFCAGTAARAMRLLEEELDRRSLGLFGADDITFIHAS